MRRSGVRIPLPPGFARVVEVSEDCRAVALAKAGTLRLASRVAASYDSASSNRKRRALALAQADIFSDCNSGRASFDSASHPIPRFEGL